MGSLLSQSIALMFAGVAGTFTWHSRQEWINEWPQDVPCCVGKLKSHRVREQGLVLKQQVSFVGLQETCSHRSLNDARPLFKLGGRVPSMVPRLGHILEDDREDCRECGSPGVQEERVKVRVIEKHDRVTVEKL